MTHWKLGILAESHVVEMKSAVMRFVKPSDDAMNEQLRIGVHRAQKGPQHFRQNSTLRYLAQLKRKKHVIIQADIATKRKTVVKEDKFPHNDAPVMRSRKSSRHTDMKMAAKN
ncbi:hypothetical protein CDAR_576961 [Caerostris darwini]|uniref:Uncharacterized protein n=1 Tax=Caerostris darwini TaxID=1538125 RepID=A0AAV4R712_9ARAC|nr:hypothetical protein CDAR_576961 [Caerostris darwini]